MLLWNGLHSTLVTRYLYTVLLSKEHLTLVKKNATIDQIPSLIGYVSTTQLPDMSLFATLAVANFSGTPTVVNREVLTQNTSVLPAYYNLGRYITMDVVTASTANLDFYSFDVTVEGL